MSGQGTEHYQGQDLEALANLRHYTRWILDGFAPHLRGRVLEVGAGIGNVSARYLDQVQAATLVEPAANLYARLEQRFAGNTSVQTFCGTLAELPAEHREFDCALMVNVLEHIADDRAVLRQLAERVRPGGAVLIFVPALQALYGSLDAMVGHERRYAKRELGEKLRGAGLRIEKLHYMDVIGMAPWLVAGRVLRQRSFHAGGAELFDRWAVPVGRALESVVAPPIGKSLLAVAIRD